MPRQEKIEKALKKEVSNIIHDELKDPRLGFITITKVKLSPDIRYAQIFYSVLGKDEDYRKTQEALDSSRGFIRKLIAQRINLRFAPEIAFKEDRSYVYNIRIQEVLDEIKELDKSNEPRPSCKIEGGKGKEGRGEPKKSTRLRKKK